MKKFKILAITAIVLGSISSADAQFLAKAALPTEESVSTSKTTASAARYSKASMMTTKAGQKAVKKFTSHFRDGDDVTWVQDKDVITAYFDRDNVKTTVVYTKKGRWLRDMLSYTEDKMPKHLQKSIKRSGYGNYKINLVQEIHENADVFYVLHLEDEKTVKKVIAYNGELTLYEGFDKQ
ncbi:hypothetical protein [Aridibaculum aurantiacum]|uniref:hypothetical protein n=1 Tax=Aridibaculum aurantiacum TaxID=2810307 RepID=UPI001A97326F|nr:hypothetical protein [Aridibaculum aurantiacum]